MNSLRFSLARSVRAAGFAVAACLVFTFPFSAANAGFFDFLFAPLHPAPVQPSYSDQYNAQSFPRKKRVAARRPKVVVARMHPGHDGHGAHSAPTVVSLMDDESLRNGDVVMTPDGLRVFTGSSGGHHNDDDFARITETEGLSKTELSTLLFLDTGAADARAEQSTTLVAGAADAGTQQSTLVAGRSVAEASATAGETVTDSRGNKIRYVGP
jgi:hypothetical protein